MRRPIVILFAALALGAAVFAGAFFGARYFSTLHMAQSTDDLDWLRMEFGLKAAELARIRELHDGYLPKCEINCAQIAARKQALQQAIAAGTNSPATLDALRAEVTRWRTKCQDEMLAHFEDVSRAMPGEQGRRYLAEMRRLTLGEHEQVEQSMLGTNHDAHGHH